MSDQNSVGEGYREALHDGLDCLNPRIQKQLCRTGEWVDRNHNDSLSSGIRYRVPVEPEPECRDLAEGEIVLETDECQPVPDGPWYVWDTSQAPAIGKTYNPAYHWPRRRKISKPEPAVPVAKTTPVENAMATLSEAMQKDSDFAWGWHCNVAMAAVDAGAPHRNANEHAATFMKNAFGVDVRSLDVWKNMLMNTVDTVQSVESNAVTNDPVHIPAHYTQGPIESEKPLTIYIAGPMRGKQFFNFPAFDEAKRELESQGFTVISPADLDREACFDPEILGSNYDWTDLNKCDFSLMDAIDRDVAGLKRCDAIFMLRGWESSKGATAEKALAEWMRLEVLYQDGDDILEEALRITKGDRNASYGPPDEDFQRTAQMWSAIKGVPFEAREVAMFMVALKLSRETHQHKRDNWVDMAGYARCGSLCK